MKSMTIAMSLLLTCNFLTAGSVRILSCSDPGCGFTERINFGGRENINQIFGFCYKCKKSTNWEWRNGFDANIPKPITTFIDPVGGKIQNIYPYIRCNEPFIQITDPATIKKCPKCLKTSLNCSNALMYID